MPHYLPRLPPPAAEAPEVAVEEVAELPSAQQVAQLPSTPQAAAVAVALPAGVAAISTSAMRADALQ